MDFTGVLCMLSFFTALRLMGFRFFRPTVCPRCQRDETTARRELWMILNTTGGVGPQKCTEELTQQGVDNSDTSDDSEDSYNGEDSENSQPEQQPLEDQSGIIEQMLNELKKKTNPS
jgi:hypothetical protein